MAHLISVHEFPKGKEILINADHIESVSVVDGPNGPRSAIRMANEKAHHVIESLDDLIGLCLHR